jgi:uncharacterized tellurite resistance protein B-like protein
MPQGEKHRIHVYSRNLRSNFGGTKLSSKPIQRRTSKKRRITQIMDAMYRLDAIYPELKENDAFFLSLIGICWLILADKLIHPLETRLVYKLHEPLVKLRRDDIRLICDRIEKQGMNDQHLHWLMMFLGTSLTPERKTGFVRKMWAVAFSDTQLHQSEVLAIRRVASLFGMEDEQIEGLRIEGKAMAGH